VPLTVLVAGVQISDAFRAPLDEKESVVMVGGRGSGDSIRHGRVRIVRKTAFECVVVVVHEY